MSPMLELRNVSKVFGEGDTAVHVLRDVDLVVRPGELVAIMGPSGSGKSSLLTIAGALEDATRTRTAGVRPAVARLTIAAPPRASVD